MKAFKAIDYAKDSNWWKMVKQSSNTMGLADWLVFAFCLGFPMTVGVYFMMQAKRAAAKNPGGAMEEYMMASKSAEVFPLALSIVTSFMSAITVLGVPGDVPASNTAYVWFLLTFTIVCALTALVYVPVFYNMEIKSTYEYLNRKELRKLLAWKIIFQISELFTGDSETRLDLWALLLFSCRLRSTSESSSTRRHSHFQRRLGSISGVLWSAPASSASFTQLLAG